MKLSVVIPAYNENGNIQITLMELQSLLAALPEVSQLQIIVVDDHSTDGTFDAVCHMDDPQITAMRLSRRSGSHIAIRAGLRESTGDAVLCLSADGQDDPSCIIQMLKERFEGAKVVWAIRNDRKNEPVLARLFAGVFYRTLSRLTPENQSVIDLSRADFFLLDKLVVDAINRCNEMHTSLFGLICWMGFEQRSVIYDRRTRRIGKSKWDFHCRLQLAKDWIVAFSGIPLKLMSTLGLVVAMFGFLYAVYVIFNAYWGNPVEGWSSIVVAVFILGGIQMIMFGVLGEYLWRNINETRKRPLYIIEKKYRSTQKHHQQQNIRYMALPVKTAGEPWGQ